MQEAEKNAAFYNAGWKTQYDKEGVGLYRYNRRYKSLHVTLLNYLTPQDIVLEVACGTGHFAINYIAVRCEDFLATDFSKTAIDLAQKAFPYMARKFRVLDAFVKVKFRYNTVVALEFLEHTDRDVEFLTLHEKGTKIVFSVPLNEKQKKGKPGYPAGWASHRRIYTQETLIDRYESVIDIKTIKRVARGRAKWLAVLGYRK